MQKLISDYLEGGTIISDLLQSGTLTLNSKGGYDEKQLVCWIVNGFEDEEPACWKNQKLFQAFIHYYCERISGRDAALCMVCLLYTSRCV